jgi:DNA-binding NarL/FixJ family response regulator
MTRLVIADDHPLIRAGFRQIASNDATISVVGEAGDGATLLEVLKATPADVVALDINMPGPGFVELIRQIRKDFPDVGVLVVSMYPEEEFGLPALQAGAAGYLTKAHAEEELVAAVRKVGSGGRFVTPSLAESLAIAAQRGFDDTQQLSPREHEVLDLLGAGKTYKEIGTILGMSPKTVGTYRSRILGKLKLKTTADLIRYVERRQP